MSSGSNARGRNFGARFLWVAALVVLDLLSKWLVFAYLQEHKGELAFDGHGHARLVLCDPWLAFMRSTNLGMAWGFDKLPPYVLILGRAAAVVFLSFLVVRANPDKRLLLAALVLILSGAIGNLVDNLTVAPPPGRPFGPVRDFIDVYFTRWDWHFPTFNVADSCITVGAVLLFASGIFDKPKQPASETRARP